MWNFIFDLLPGFFIRVNNARLNDFYLSFARRAYSENEADRGRVCQLSDDEKRRAFLDALIEANH